MCSDFELWLFTLSLFSAERDEPCSPFEAEYECWVKLLNILSLPDRVGEVVNIFCDRLGGVNLRKSSGNVPSMGGFQFRYFDFDFDFFSLGVEDRTAEDDGGIGFFTSVFENTSSSMSRSKIFRGLAVVMGLFLVVLQVDESGDVHMLD